MCHRFDSVRFVFVWLEVVLRGRIKRKQALLTGAHPRPVVSELPICPLCERPVPASQADAHHLVPKSRGGVQTVNLHRICHRQVHALLTEVELERHYCTIESLKSHPELARFLLWVKGKPDDFSERVRKSKRLKASR